MLGFFKKILGLPTEEEKQAAKVVFQAPYKIEAPIINNKTGEILETSFPTSVNDQITDSVTQTLRVRKPRKIKEKKLVKEVKAVVTKEKPTKTVKEVKAVVTKEKPTKTVAENKKAVAKKPATAAKKTTNSRLKKV